MTSIRSGWMTPPPAMRESWKAAWIRRCASAACRASTTTEMLSSELPCAMATTLIFAGRERGEHRRRHARRAVHAEAHDRHRGHAEAQLDAVDLAAADLAGELPLQALARVGRRTARAR